ncbi:uncharacterized protein LOC129238750 isoform X1 [Anastrepha obliqua]|uniref:uncharacterized protein LOC129238750 isoform X1 n=1 Tax=Anastrepha obliqua TaxID=95512 RepID=UPI0024096FEB|nr:uncharacterized protein LOC129238750 isoform X1 [Anastrepha obliqua]
MRRTRLTSEAKPSLNSPSSSINRTQLDESISCVDNYRKNRATLAQLLYLVNFARKHPKIITSKFGPVSTLWEELADELNSMEGAYRSADKWRESMSTWRSQLRCRARRGKSSGVPEFDEFASFNFGQQALTSDTDEVEDRSNAIRTQKKCKGIFKHDAKTEIVLEPEADIEIQKEIVPPTVGSALPEGPGFSSGQGLSLRHMYGNVINVDTTTTTIKKEIDCFNDDDINKVTEICEDISDEDSKPDAILDFEAEMDMKTEIELANDEYTTPELNTPTSLINVPTLGFPVTTQSQICVTLQPNTSLNATMLASGEADRVTTSDKSKKSVEKACKKRKIAVLPCPSDITNASDVGHKERRVFTISPPSTSLNISTQATVDTAQDEKIVLSHPSPTTAKGKRENARSKITLDPSLIPAEVTGTESFNTKHSSHTSVPEDTTNGSKKRKITSLNEMYETVLKSINKRDEREEQMMGILQGLTVAVTRLTDNVQRLEEVLTFCKNN